MSHRKIQFLAAVALTIAAIIAFTITVKAGELRVTASAAPASIGAARTGAAYVTISNETGMADRLVSVASDIARKTEIHNHLMEDGVMKMRRADGVDIPAGGQVTFRPGGYHVMFFGLTAPLQVGDSFRLELAFENAGKTEITVPVVDRKDIPAPHTMGN